jgi:cytochrome c5
MAAPTARRSSTTAPAPAATPPGSAAHPSWNAAGIGARLAEQGLDTLVSKAISGFQGSAGVMPAKGGNPALTDEQIKATVEWMVAQSK